MTTIRLTAHQKRKLQKVHDVLQKTMGRTLSQGEAVAALSEFALRHRDLLARAASEPPGVPDNDPFYDLSIVFDLGRTDERTHDRLLYGRR